MGSIVDDMQLVVRFALGKINTGMMVEFMDEIAPLTLAKSLTILARRCRWGEEESIPLIQVTDENE